MMRKIAAAFAALMLTAGLSLAGAAPARAAWSDCGSYPETICLFANAGWGTPIWRQTPEQIPGCRALTGFNDITTIAVNNTAGSVNLKVWRHANCTDLLATIGSGTHVLFTGTSNDEASAVSLILL